jgi:branched-chain amino acid transport system ATP-binding protein
MIETNSVTMRFGGVVALTDVSMAVREGVITSLIGPNGAGKTTMFNCITSVCPPSSGSIRIDGAEITKLAPHEIAYLGVARTFQTALLFDDMSLLENVMVGQHKGLICSYVDSALRLPMVGRKERQGRDEAMHYLDVVGLASQAPQQAGSLPYGKKRLLEVARALASKPKFLLLDEPAAGLNNEETLFMADLIAKIKERGVTVLLVEHDMGLVMDISDHIVVLNFGKKLAEGTPAEVRANPLVIQAYLGEEQ